MNKGYFSTTEIAKILGISSVAVWKKIKSGEIKAEKFGRNYLIKKEDFLKFSEGVLSEEKKEEIKKAVKKIVGEYEEALKLLGKE